MKKQSLTIFGLMLSALLVSGCQSTSEIAAVRALAEQAQADAQAANSTANEAKTIAQRAMQMSQATDERINRMFKRSMLK